MDREPEKPEDKPEEICISDVDGKSTPKPLISEILYQ
jgi:hypothetical protein